MVDDDDGDESPSPEPRTDSRSALPREIRAWRRLRIMKRDESISLIFSPRNGIYRVGVEVGGAVGGPQDRGAPPLGRALLSRGAPGPPPTSTPTPYIPSRGEKIREKVSSCFTIRSRRQALISLGRVDLESVRGSGEGDSSPSSSSTILHHQFHDDHRRV